MTTHLFRPATHRGLTGHAGSPRGAELTHNDWDGGRTVSRAIALGDRSSLWTVNPDGSDLRLQIGFEHWISHFAWQDAEMLLSLGFYRSEEIFRGEIRCDLHPRWTPDGRGLTIDAVPEGDRQSI
jgi:hypothetical protein